MAIVVQVVLMPGQFAAGGHPTITDDFLIFSHLSRSCKLDETFYYLPEWFGKSRRAQRHAEKYTDPLRPLR
ncbi:MAG: hypothetical protein ACT6FD_01585 [Methanosarcinaceae archaeon]